MACCVFEVFVSSLTLRSKNSTNLHQSLGAFLLAASACGSGIFQRGAWVSQDDKLKVAVFSLYSQDDLGDLAQFSATLQKAS